MKKLVCILLTVCVLGLTGCAAQVETGDGIDFRPAHALAKQCFEAKMQAEGVEVYTIEEHSISVRTGRSIFEAEFIYTADGGEKQTYMYRIRSENGITEVLEEGENFRFPYMAK